MMFEVNIMILICNICFKVTIMEVIEPFKLVMGNKLVPLKSTFMLVHFCLSIFPHIYNKESTKYSK